MSHGRGVELKFQRSVSQIRFPKKNVRPEIETILRIVVKFHIDTFVSRKEKLAQQIGGKVE